MKWLAIAITASALSQPPVCTTIQTPGESEPVMWPGGVVPYAIQYAGQWPHEPYLDWAIGDVERSANIRFVPRTIEDDYLLIVPSDVNASYVGMRGGPQNLWMFNFTSVGTWTHELMHAVGLYHEQSRPDRDRYVEIVWGNIDPFTVHNFWIYPGRYAEISPYDYASIMHYPRCAFGECTDLGCSLNLPECITIIAPVEIGARTMSVNDRLDLAGMYGPPAHPGDIDSLLDFLRWYFETGAPMWNLLAFLEAWFA